MVTSEKRRAQITLPADDQILITREFDAPAAAVYRALTTPELVRRWWCGQRGVVTECEIDLRVGGAWRYVMQAHGGFEVAFRGVYRELVPGERIVSTEVYEGMPEAEALNTTTLVESEGRTTLSILVHHQKPEFRDAHLQSGMEGGLGEALDLLEQLTAPGA